MIKLLSYADLERAGFGSRTTVWRRVRAGEFPAPRDLGHGRLAWDEAEILEWVASRPIAEIAKRASEAA